MERRCCTTAELKFVLSISGLEFLTLFLFEARWIDGPNWDITVRPLSSSGSKIWPDLCRLELSANQAGYRAYAMDCWIPCAAWWWWNFKEVAWITKYLSATQPLGDRQVDVYVEITNTKSLSDAKDAGVRKHNLGTIYPITGGCTRMAKAIPDTPGIRITISQILELCDWKHFTEHVMRQCSPKLSTDLTSTPMSTRMDQVHVHNGL